MKKVFRLINIIFLISVLILTGIYSGCSRETAEKNVSFNSISPQEARKRLDNEKDIILLDVRTKEEYDTGHIKNSILIPVDNLREEAEKTLNDKEKIIFIYCRSGNRSKTAAGILVNLGYKNVYDLGGIIDWPYEIIK